MKRTRNHGEISRNMGDGHQPKEENSCSISTIFTQKINRNCQLCDTNFSPNNKLFEMKYKITYSLGKQHFHLNELSNSLMISRVHFGDKNRTFSGESLYFGNIFGDFFSAHMAPTCLGILQLKSWR